MQNPHLIGEPLSFESLEAFVKYIKDTIQKTELLKKDFKIVADVVKVKPYGGSYFVTVTQELLDGKNVELQLSLWSNYTPKILNQLGLKSFQQLEHKKWEFYGRLGFYENRVTFTFNVLGIAPIGESEILKRRELIKKQLDSEGLLMKTKHELSELEPIRYIAVITSGTAMGYSDFLSNLLLPEPYRPTVHLYKAIMQGVNTPESVMRAIDNIFDFMTRTSIRYDAIVIIRGGGAPSDLMYFDDLELGRKIAKISNYVPVFTGIGHQDDYTIPDFVAWKRFATPTAVAKEISEQIRNYLEYLNKQKFEIGSIFETSYLKKSNLLTMNIFSEIENSFKNTIEKNSEILKKFKEDISRLFETKPFEELLSLESLKEISYTIDRNISSISEKLPENQELDIFLSRNLKEAINVLENYCKDVAYSFNEITARIENYISNFEQEIISKGGMGAVLLYGGAVFIKDGRWITSTKHINPGEPFTARLRDGKILIIPMSVEDDL